MARLNEPASTAVANTSESLESLKRRFIRQNRDLARSNSTQSIKIRNLETQISQLVANNVSLRATIVQLQSELDGSRTRSVVENVDDVKRRLEEKLNEIGGLVAELNRPRSKPSVQPKSPSRSAAQKMWMATSGIGDGLEGRQGWLPTIAEGKYFPRRTLEPTELSELIADGFSDSPDIGPPPQTSVDTDNASANQLELATDQNTSTDEDSSLSSLLSANFETRRRRRVSNGGLDTTTTNTSDAFPSKENNANRQPDLWTAQPIRAGAKRKLDIANRPNENNGASSKNKDAVAPPNTDLPKEAENQKSPARRVLAPKSVNTDPALSPKKLPANGKPEAKPTQRNNTKENHQQIQMHRITKSKEKNVNQDLEIVKTVGLPPPPENVKLEPKTPAPLDLFSPMSTETSEPRPEGRGDTPPPANLASRGGIRGENATAGRGSRRARASVNYAEPNLISKMRRPTKDLVDAVWNDARANSASVEHPTMKREVSSSQPPSNGEDEEKEHRVSAGKGPAPVEDSRPEPQSPLGQKDDTNSAIPPPFERSTTRDRRRSALHQSNSSATLSDEQTGPSAAIAALTAGSRKASAADKDAAVSSLGESVQKLDIFDVAPSPPRPFGQLKAKDKSEDARPSSATSVRSNGGASDKKVRQPASALSSSSLNRPRSRRQTIGVDKGAQQGSSFASTTNTAASKDRPVKSSRTAASLSENAPSEAKTTAERIAERTAARRRSMML